MAGRRGVGPEKYWDVIVSSNELKKLIKQRADRYHVSFFKLAKEIGVDYEYLKKYYLNRVDVLSTPNIRQKQIIHLAELVGIDVRITLVMEEEEKFLGKLKQVRNRPYEHHGRSNKKKGTTTR